MADIDLIMNCYLWELETILEGLALRELDKQGQDVVFGFNLRYILNAKKPQINKISDKEEVGGKVRGSFTCNQKQVSKNHQRLEEAARTLEHFRNRR